MWGRDRIERLDGAGESGSRRSFFLLFLIYTGLFAIVAAAAYFMFIYESRTFLRFGFTNKDSFSQRYMFLFEFRRFIENLFAGGTVNTWDWSIGLGADAYSFNISNMVNPLAYFAAFCPDEYVDVAYSLTIVARVYLSGVTFMLFARKIGFDDLKTVLGAMMYAFSPWIIVNSVAQGTFIIATVMLPLVLLGAEKVIRGESPVVFILSVAYTVLVSFIFAYMIALLTLIYFPVRYWTGGYGDWKNFFRRLGAFLAAGTTGIMISGFGLVVTMMKYSNSTATTGKTIHMLFSMTDYLRTPLKLVSLSTMFGSSSVLGVAALGLALIPVIVICFFKRKTNAVMTGLLFILAMIPYTSSVFNFFSYISGRWFFGIAFFYALAAAEAFDDEYLKKLPVRISIVAVFAVYTAYLAWIQKILTTAGKMIMLSNWAAAFIVIVLILIAYRGEGVRIMESRRLRTVTTSLICVAMVLGLTTAYNVNFFKLGKGFLETGKADDLIDASVQRIGKEIEDDDFYRVDQVGDLLGINDPHCKVNEAIYYGNRSNYVFCSSVDNDWLIYNKLLGNNQGYYKRVAPNSNDDRFGLDYLQGVKYFIGDDVSSGDSEVDTTPYAAYGFDPAEQKTVDGVELMENDHSIGLGCVFTNYMRESEWMKLSYLDREVAMLKAAVIADDQDAPSGLKELKADDLKSGIKKIEYTRRDKTADGKKFILSAENDDEHQVFVIFRNIRTDLDTRYTVRVNNGMVRKTAINTVNDERGFPDIKDLMFNLGSGSKATENVNVHLIPNGEFKHEAEFIYDDIEMYQVPLNVYEKAADTLDASKFQMGSFGNDKIEGTVSLDKPGLLYLSVPDDDGWRVKVDGKTVDKRNGVDIAFTGVDLEAGNHTVELEYHTRGLLPGILISVLGVIVMIAILVIRARTGKREE